MLTSSLMLGEVFERALNLRHFKMYGNALTTISFNPLSQALRKLEKLKLEFVHLDGITLNSILAQAGNLTLCTLSYCETYPGAVVNLDPNTQALCVLKSLTIINCNLSFKLRGLDDLLTRVMLRQLHFEYTFEHTLPNERIFENMQSRCTSLCLHFSNITGAHISEASFQCLTQLDLRYTPKFTDEALQSIFFQATSLTSLTFKSFAPIPGNCFQIDAAHPALKKLRKLDIIEWNDLTDENLNAALKRAKALEYLGLVDCPKIGDKSFTFAPNEEALTALTTLEIRPTQGLTNLGLSHLIERATRLRALYFYEWGKSHITDPCYHIPATPVLQNLRMLYLESNVFTQRGYKNLLPPNVTTVEFSPFYLAPNVFIGVFSAACELGRTRLIRNILQHLIEIMDFNPGFEGFKMMVIRKVYKAWLDVQTAFSETAFFLDFQESFTRGIELVHDVVRLSDDPTITQQKLEIATRELIHNYQGIITLIQEYYTYTEEEKREISSLGSKVKELKNPKLTQMYKQ